LAISLTMSSDISEDELWFEDGWLETLGPAFPYLRKIRIRQGFGRVSLFLTRSTFLAQLQCRSNEISLTIFVS
jgi:hypothetical protein